MIASKPTHGGKRPNAGRKKIGVRVGTPHRARPALSHRHPVHVVLRTREGVPALRQACMYHAIRGVLPRYVDRGEFRIVHVSLQRCHLHLLVEANDAGALRRGMQSFAINTARAINSAWGRIGAVFAYRYHATQITTSRYARNALAYVLGNWRRHREDFLNGALLPAKLDPYSSAVSFGGWNRRFATPPRYRPLSVSPPRTELLRVAWLRHGRLDPDACPGAIA